MSCLGYITGLYFSLIPGFCISFLVMYWGFVLQCEQSLCYWYINPMPAKGPHKTVNSCDWEVLLKMPRLTGQSQHKIVVKRC